MEDNELQKLRTKAKEIISDIIQNCGDKYCNGCVWFRYRHARAGAPENTPTMSCGVLEYSSPTGKREETIRFIDCFLMDYKETK